MIVETQRIWSDWLKDSGNGVNAHLLQIPLDGTDPRPAPVAFIGDQTRDKVVARWEQPLDFPAIYVTMDGPAIGQGEVSQIHRDFDDVVIAIRLLVKNPDTQESVRDTFYYLRAIVRSVKALAHNDQAPERNRGGIYVGTVKAITYGRWSEAVGSATATGAVTITHNVRDKQT